MVFLDSLPFSITFNAVHKLWIFSVMLFLSVSWTKMLPSVVKPPYKAIQNNMSLPLSCFKTIKHTLSIVYGHALYLLYVIHESDHFLNTTFPKSHQGQEFSPILLCFINKVRNKTQQIDWMCSHFHYTCGWSDYMHY